LRTWREKKDAEEASGRWSRQAVSEGCSTIVMIPMFLIGGIGALVAFFALMLGIDVLAGRMAGFLGSPPMLALIGAGTIALAGWGLIRIAKRRATPDVSRRDKVIAVVSLVALVAIGVVVLLAAIAPQVGSAF
jgi:hypothetical protein